MDISNLRGIIFDIHKTLVDDRGFPRERIMKECRIYEEVPRVLEILRSKYQIGLLSNADNDDPLIEILLKSGLKFDSIVTSESVKAYKPNPVVFQKILSEMKLQKHQGVLIGDSQIADVLGGKRFGIRVVWINGTNDILREGIPQPDYEIPNLSELLCIIGR